MSYAVSDAALATSLVRRRLKVAVFSPSARVSRPVRVAAFLSAARIRRPAKVPGPYGGVRLLSMTPVRPVIRTATLVKQPDAQPLSSQRVTTFVKFAWSGDRIAAGRLQLGSSGHRSDTVGTLVLTVYDLDDVVTPDHVRFYVTVGSGARSGPYPAHRTALAGTHDTVYERDVTLDTTADTLVEAEVVVPEGTAHAAEAIRFDPAAA